MEKLTCRKCGAALPARRSEAGRPADYCSTGCRRAAEFEIRRVNRALEQAEDAARAHREHLAVRPHFGLSCCGSGDVVERHLTFLTEECGRLETRLVRLLGEQS